MKPKAVFFDVDGTIIPLKVVIKTFQDTCKHFNVRIVTDKEILNYTIGLKLEEAIAKVLPEAIPIKKEFIKFLICIYSKYFINSFC